MPPGWVAPPTPDSADRSPAVFSRTKQDLSAIPAETPGSDRMVNSVIRRLAQRPGKDWQATVRDISTTFGSSERSIMAALETKATPEQRSFLIRNGFPLKAEVEEDYQNGTSGGYQNQSKPTTSQAAKPTTGPKPTGTKPATPAKPIAKTDLDKAGKLADKIATTPNLDLSRPDALNTQIKQKIGSIGGRPDQAGMMGNLVRAELANRGFELDEGINDFITERGFGDILRAMTGNKAPAAPAPAPTKPTFGKRKTPPKAPAAAPAAAPAPQAAAKAPAPAPATSRPHVERTMKTNFRSALTRTSVLNDLDDVLRHTNMWTKRREVEDSLEAKGQYSVVIGHGKYDPSTESWLQINRSLGRNFRIGISGEGPSRTLTIYLLANN